MFLQCSVVQCCCCSSKNNLHFSHPSCLCIYFMHRQHLQSCGFHLLQVPRAGGPSGSWHSHPRNGGTCAQRGPTDRGHPLLAVSLDTLAVSRGKSPWVLSHGIPGGSRAEPVCSCRASSMALPWGGPGLTRGHWAAGNPCSWPP